MSKEQIIKDYRECAQNWFRMGCDVIASSYLAVLECDGMENWTPAERENRRIQLMNEMRR